MMLRSGWAVIAAVCACLALGAPARAADKLRVGKPFATGFDFAILQVGIDSGIFKRHDIDIDTITLSGSAKLHSGMISDSIDVALGAGTDFAFIAKGAPEKGVAAMAGAPLNIAVVVRADGPIKTLADLKGKRVGVSSLVSLTWWLGQQLSLRQGWGTDGLVFAETGSGQASVAALVSGGIDAMVGSLEGGLMMEKAGKARVITTFADVSPFLTHMISATDNLIAKHPDALRRFLAGWFETVAYMKANKAEAIRLSRSVTQLSPDVAEKVYDIEMPMYFTDGHFDPKAVAAVKEAIIATGEAKSLPPDGKLFTEQFLP